MEPIIVTSKAHLREAVSDAVAAAIKQAAADTPAERPKAWLTNAEAQRYLGVSRGTLARHRANGVLPYSKVGASVYYRLEDVEALLTSHVVNPSST